MNTELSKIVNDHDWISRRGTLARQDDNETKEAVLKLQKDFRRAGLIDPLCDEKGIGGADLEANPWREILRTCLLCPMAYAPVVGFLELCVDLG